MRAARWGEWSFRLAMAGSVFLCCAAALLWYRGRQQHVTCWFYECDRVGYTGRRAAVCLWSGAGRVRGSVCVFHEQIPYDFQGFSAAETPEDHPIVLDQLHLFGAGVHTDTVIVGNNSESYATAWADVGSIWAPHWAIMMAGITSSAALFARRCMRRKTATAGARGTCGYDLRASPERCPECGTPKVLSIR